MAETPVENFRTVNIAPACNEVLEMRFGEPGTWYGWLYGPKWRDSIPYYFLDPSLNGGRACVKGDPARPPRIHFAPAQHLFAVFGVAGDAVAPPTPIARVRVVHEGGRPAEMDVTSYRRGDVNCDFPLRNFNTYVVMLSAPDNGRMEGLEVLDGRLFALTALSVDEKLAQVLRGRFDSDVKAALAEAQRGRYLVAYRDLQDGPEWLAPEASHRIVMDVAPAQDMKQPVLRVPLDLDLLCKQVQSKPLRAPFRVRCVDQTTNQAQDVPAQFDLFKDGRGTLVCLPPDEMKASAAKRYVVYFIPSASPSVEGKEAIINNSAATVTSGKGGVQFTFNLQGEGDGPKLMDLRFDLNGDGRFDEPNVLGETGFSGGYGCLTSCYDPLFWFNFGAFQKEPARARIVHSGPASTTIVVENLQLFGIGGPLELKRTDGKTYPIGPKGAAQWFFRTYSNRPHLDQWVEWNIADADTGWTRPLQVRYGLAKFDPNVIGTGGRPGEPAESPDLCALGAAEEEQRVPPITRYTKDGHVIEVQLADVERVGRYASDFWRMSPSQLGADELKRSLLPPAVEVYALECKEGDRIVRRPPSPARGEPVSTVDGPIVQPGPEPPLPGALNWDTSFEKPKDYWGLSNDASWSRQAAHSGKQGALLEVNKEAGKTLALISTSERVNREMALDPNTKYKLTLWARCTSEKGLLRADLYAGAGYDFNDAVTLLPGDGKWHRYEVELSTGAFPPPPPPGKVFVQPSRIFPSLRLWCLNDDQVVHVDDVCLTPKP